MLRSRVSNLTKSEDVLFARVQQLEQVLIEVKRDNEESKAAERVRDFVLCSL